MTVTVDRAVMPSHPGRHDSGGTSVVVATFKRLEQLTACLDGIETQTLRANEVLVVTHADPQSERYVTSRRAVWPELRLVEAERGRSVAAYNAGLRAATMAFVIYIDDDAVPARDWLERLVATFQQDEQIAAVGGRDVIVVEGRPHGRGRRRRRPLEVGRIQWSGRMTANHHLGTGAPRDVDVLKGVNMGFRTSAVAEHGFDERLRGPGAVVHAELSICLPLRRQGLRIVYDPLIVVTHYPAPRPAGDHRASVSAESALNTAHNQALQILEYLSPSRRLVFLAWSLLIGSTEAPGLAVLVRDLTRRRLAPQTRFLAAQRGVAAALWTGRRRRATLSGPHDRRRVGDHAQPGDSATMTSRRPLSSDPKISVIIATRDRPELIRRVARQVLRQLNGGDELIIVDDSTSPADREDWLGDDVQVLRSGGRGPAAARNLGWHASAGEVVAFTDDDVQLDPYWLSAIRKEFAGNAALVGIEGRTVTRPFDPLYEYSVQADRAWNGLTCNVAYRRAALEHLDGFDESFRFAHCEDVDLFTRAKHLGDVEFAGDMIVDHEPRKVLVAEFARRGGWLASERRLYIKHPGLKPYRLPPGLCAVIVYLRWPVQSLFSRSTSGSSRPMTRLRRTGLLTALWWWNVVKAVPSLVATRP